MSALRHSRIRTNGLSQHAVEAGALDAPLMLFLHGFPECWMSWQPLLHAFSTDYLAVAVDNRGFGESDKPQDISEYVTDKITGDLLALANHYEREKLVLVGHDWGGLAAWQFAMCHPQRLSGLVVLNAPHPMLFQHAVQTNLAQRAASQYFNRLRDDGTEARLLALGIENFWTSLFSPHFKRGAITAEQKSAYLESWSAAGGLTSMLNWYRASSIIVPPLDAPVIAEPLLPAVPPIEVPSLIIWGMRDSVLLPCLLDGLGQVAPNHELVELAQAGHGLLHEAPDAIIAAMRSWLARRVIS